MYLKGNSSRIDFFTQPSISIGGTVTSKYYDIFVVDDPDVQYVRHWSNGFDVNMSVPDARQFIVSNTDGTYAFGPGVSDGDIAFKIIPESSTELRYNKVKKLETTGYGVTVSGGLNVSGVSTFQNNVSIDGTTTKLSLDAPTSASGILSNPKIEIGTPTSGRYYNVLAVDATPVQYVRHLAADLDFNISVSNDRTFLISGGLSATQALNSLGVNDSDIAFKLNPDTSTELRYNKSKKFETTGYGVTVTGGAYVSGISTFQDDVHLLTNDNVYFGNNNDIRIYSDGSTGRLITSDTFYVRAPQLGVLNNSGTQNIAIFDDSNGVKLYHAGNKKLETTGYGVSVTDGLNVSGVSTFLDNVRLGIGTNGSNITRTYNTDINGDSDVLSITSVNDKHQVVQIGFSTTAGTTVYNANLQLEGKLGNTLFDYKPLIEFKKPLSIGGDGLEIGYNSGTISHSWA